MRRAILNFFGRHASPKPGHAGGWTYLVAGLILAGCVTACSSSDKRPTGILSKEEMVKVLTDFHLKEARVITFNITSDSAKVLFRKFREKYALTSGVADSTIDISYQYYLLHPQELDDIYNRIIDSLSLKHHKVGSEGVEK